MGRSLFRQVSRAEPVPLFYKMSSFIKCHPERSEGSVHSARSGGMHRSFEPSRRHFEIRQTLGVEDVFRGPAFSRGPEIRGIGSTLAGVI